MNGTKKKSKEKLNTGVLALLVLLSTAGDRSW